MRRFLRGVGDVVGILLVIGFAAALIWYAWRNLDGWVAAGRPATSLATPTKPPPKPDTVTVDYVIDGDTVDVIRNEETLRVRLLNIDTPETKDPDLGVECLGPEARAFLAGLLPKGTDIRLEYDVDQRDRFGRTLAGVYVGKRLINAEIAAAGYSATLDVGRNTRLHAAVERAHAQAVAQQKGLYSPTIACTLPGRVVTLVEALDVAEPTEQSSQTYTTAAAKLDEAIADGHDLLNHYASLDPVRDQGLLLAYDETYRRAQLATLDTAVRAAESSRDAWRNKAERLAAKGR